MNKTEQKRQRQQAKREQEQQQSSQRRVQQAMLWGIPGVLLLVVGYFVYQIFTAPTPLAGEITAADHIRGNAEASVVLVKYSDFQCPACAYYSAQLKEAWPAIGEQVQFIYRHFPLTNIHDHAELSAAYTEAAARQGKFWEMHDIIFENQAQWSDLSDARPAFDRYARSLNLDLEQLHEDLDAPEVQEKIRADTRSASQSGVAGTPTFFLNGRRMDNPNSAAGFVFAIREAAGEQ